jgi:fibronectin-binding autotransporter adhesin
MSAISWKYNTDGVWSNAANWSSGVLPGAADDVTLATLSAHTITYSSGSTQIHSLTATTDSLNISGGTLGILASASFAKLLEVSGGTLSLLGTSETVSGTLQALSGQILLASGNTLTDSGIANIASSTTGTGPNLDGPGTLSTLGTTTIGQTSGGNYDALILGGGVTWKIGATVNDAGQIAVGDSTGVSATLLNAAGVSFNLTTDHAGISNIGYSNPLNVYVYGTSTFSNAGTLAKTGGTNTSNIASVFTNTGVINAATGTIAFGNGGSFGGTLTGAGTIAFAGGTATLSNPAAVTVANLLMDGGTVSVASPFSYAGSLTLSAGTLTFAGATNSIANFSETGNSSAHLVVSGASLALTNASLGGGYVDSIGAGTVSLGGTTALAGINNYSIYLGGGVKLANTGVVNQNYYVYVDYGAGSGFTISNAAGATYNVTGDYSLGYNNSSGTSSTFTNAGTFAKSGGTGVTQVESVFSSTGVINAATGTIEFDNGGSFAGTLSGAGTLAFAGGAETFANGVSIAGAGEILFDGGTVTLAGNETYSAGQLSEVSGRVLLGGHTLTAANASLGGGIIDGAGTVSLTGTSTLSGNNGSGIFSLGGGVVLNTAGVVNQNYTLYVDYASGAGFTINNAAGATYNITGNYDVGDNNSNGVTSAFINAGTFDKLSTGLTQVQSVFTNTGTVTAASGTLQFNDGGSFTGTLSGAGTIALAGGATTLKVGASFKVATLLLDGSNVTLASSYAIASTTAFVLDGGTLTTGLYNLSLASADLGYGFIDGSGTLTTGGTTTLGNYAYVEFGSGLHWTNNGTVNQYNQIYDNYVTGGAFSLTNAAAATYNVQGDYFIGGNADNGVTSSISNAGKFIKAAGTNTTYLYSTFTNLSTGTITATTGNIELDGGATLAGALTGAAAISLASNTTLSAGVSLGVANLNIYDGATITLGGATSYAGDLTFSNGTLNLSGYTLSLAAPNLNNGLINGLGTLSLTGTTALASGNFLFGGGVTIVNHGMVDQNGDVYLASVNNANFTVQNLVGATWDVINNNYIGNNIYTGSSSTFVNAGTFTQTGATSYSLVYSVFDNTGTVSVNGSGNAEIAFQSGGVFGGTFAGTGLISFQNNTYMLGGLTETASAITEFYQSTIDLTSAVSLNGTLVANGSPSTINLAGHQLTVATMNLLSPGATQYYDQGGTLSTTGTGSIVDWYNNGAMISLGGGATWVNSGSMTDGGLVQLGDANVYNGTSAGTLVNQANAVFAFSTDDAGIRQGNNNGSPGAVLSNGGLLEKTGGTGTGNVNATLTSTGTLATTSGTLAFDAGGSVAGFIAAGSSLAFNGGNFAFGALTIGGGASISDVGTVTITQTGALTLGDSSNVAANLTNNGTYVIAADVGIASAGSATSTLTNNGLLEKTAATGRSLIAAAVVNSGTISVASGTLALTGSVAGTGTMLIGTGTTLELGANIAASQSVSFTAATGTLLLDAPATAAETVYNMVVGDVIDVAGVTATKATVNASDQLVIANGATTVATVQLSGSYLSDTFTVASDGNGGEKVTLSAASTVWKAAVSGDWLGTNVWTNGPPNAETAAAIAVSGTYTVTLSNGEIAAASALAISDAGADVVLNGTLDIAKTLTATAGTIAVNGTIDGGIFISNGAAVTFNGGTLENLQYRGTIDLSENYANVSLTGTDTFAGAAGTGAGTINLTGYQTTLYADGYETLNNATIDFGSSTSGSAFLHSNDTNNQGAILTLGATLNLLHTGTNAVLSDSGNAYDAIYNDGKITASEAGGTLTVTGNEFENDGTIAISNGDIFLLDSVQTVNTKTLTVSSATLGINGAFQNTGSVTATSSVLNFNTSLTGTELAAIVIGGGNTLNLAGSLDEQGGTLAVGTAAKITSLNLSGDILNATINPTAGAVVFSNGSTLDNDTFNGTISVGSPIAVTLDDTLTNAVIADSGNGVLFGVNAELNKVTYDGTLSLLPGNSVDVLGGLTLHGIGGTGLGAISAYAGATASTLSFLDSETLSNVAITSGTGTAVTGQGLFLSEAVKGTLTLASSVSIEVGAGTTAGFLSENPTTGAALNGAIINDGLITLDAGAMFMGSDGSVASFTNAGSIALATGAEWLASGTTLTSSTFTNTTAGTITLGTSTVLQTNGGMVNAGHITLASGALVTVQGAFSETGATSVAVGAGFDIDGTTTLASVAGISGAGTLGLNGVLNLAGATFDMAASGRITNVELGGNLQSGTFSNDAGTVSFGSLSTLTSMTWKGPLAIGAGSTVDVVGALTVETAAGGVPGIVTLTGNASAGGTLDYVAGGGLANLTINSSSDAQSSDSIANVLDIGSAAGTMTLYATFTLNAGSGGTELADRPATGTPSGTLITNGHLNATSGTIWLDPSFTQVTNGGVIALSADTAFDATPGASATNQLFTNTGHITMASLDDFDLLGSATNSGVITLAAGSEMSFGGNFTNTGSITLSNGSSLTIGGTMIAAGGNITASGTSSDFVSATAGTASAFNGGTLTGGVWTVSAASTLTLNSGNAVTVDAADIVLNGANAVLRSVGTTIARLESSLSTIATTGTLALLVSRGYVTSLTLADNGTLQLQGGTLSTGGLAVGASGLLTGSGIVSGAIANAGTILATGGTLALSNAVTGAGQLQIASGAELEIGAANSETVLFNAGSAELRLDAPASFTGTLSGFQSSDSILLVSTTATAAVLSGSTLTVSLGSGTNEVFMVAGNSATVTLTTAADGSGDTLITYPPPSAHINPTPISFIAPSAAATPVPAMTMNDHLLTDFASPLAAMQPASALSAAAAFTTPEMTAALGALLDHSHAIGAANGALLTAGRA